MTNKSACEGPRRPGEQENMRNAQDFGPPKKHHPREAENLGKHRAKRRRRNCQARNTGKRRAKTPWGNKSQKALRPQDALFSKVLQNPLRAKPREFTSESGRRTQTRVLPPGPRGPLENEQKLLWPGRRAKKLPSKSMRRELASFKKCALAEGFRKNAPGARGSSGRGLQNPSEDVISGGRPCKNYEKALQVLRSRLFQAEVEKQEKERAEQRKSLVSTGDRSAKIRTYNYPQGRITDHRIGKTMYNLSHFMNGDIHEMIDALIMAENAEKLKEGTEME